MAKTIDAFGQACPMPVILAKKAADAGEIDFTVRVDNETAVQNLKRFAADRGFLIEENNVEGGFLIALKKQAENGQNADKKTETPAGNPSFTGCGTSVFIGKEYVGAGDGALGAQLMKMFLYTLSQGDDVPSSVLFMNGGVKLPTLGEEQVITSIQTLIERGCEVLVCGACLNFYGLQEKLKAGTVSNMYEIVLRMQTAAKVISI